VKTKDLHKATLSLQVSTEHHSNRPLPTRFLHGASKKDNFVVTLPPLKMKVSPQIKGRVVWEIHLYKALNKETNTCDVIVMAATNGQGFPLVSATPISTT
jgi:hypothetical protein